MRCLVLLRPRPPTHDPLYANRPKQGGYSGRSCVVYKVYTGVCLCRLRRIMPYEPC